MISIVKLHYGWIIDSSRLLIIVCFVYSCKWSIKFSRSQECVMLVGKGTEAFPIVFRGRNLLPMAKHITSHPTRHAPGQSVYERYLRTEELLSLQKPESELVHHDELQFQIV